MGRGLANPVCAGETLGKNREKYNHCIHISAGNISKTYMSIFNFKVRKFRRQIASNYRQICRITDRIAELQTELANLSEIRGGVQRRSGCLREPPEAVTTELQPVPAPPAAVEGGRARGPAAR